MSMLFTSLKVILALNKTKCFRLQEQIECERVLCDSYLISICVRLFLEKYENDVRAFCEEFQQLTLVDEKYDHLINFLQSIYSLMSREAMWQGKSLCLVMGCVSRAMFFG